MPCSLNPPQYWGNQIPSHWKSGCLFTWQYKGKHPSRSQCGQEIIVELMTDISANRLFLDLGANDGINGSSTYLLEKNRWKGMVVEPNATLIPSLLSHRPNSLILACAVGDKRGIMTLQTSDVHMLGSLIDDESSYQLQRLASESGGYSKIKRLPVAVLTVQDVLSAFYNAYSAYPDFLKIDIEGFENIAIRNLFETKCRPSVIEIENNERQSEAAELLLSEGYSLEVVMDSFVEIWTTHSFSRDKASKIFE